MTYRVAAELRDELAEILTFAKRGWPQLELRDLSRFEDRSTQERIIWAYYLWAQASPALASSYFDPAYESIEEFRGTQKAEQEMLAWSHNFWRDTPMPLQVLVYSAHMVPQFSSALEIYGLGLCCAHAQRAREAGGVLHGVRLSDVGVVLDAARVAKGSAMTSITRLNSRGRLEVLRECVKELEDDRVLAATVQEYQLWAEHAAISQQKPQETYNQLVCRVYETLWDLRDEITPICRTSPGLVRRIRLWWWLVTMQRCLRFCAVAYAQHARHAESPEQANLRRTQGVEKLRAYLNILLVAENEVGL